MHTRKMLRQFIDTVRWALVRWLIKPSIKLERDKIGRMNIGPMMVVLRPVGWRNMPHDAVRAFHCGGYTYFFYAPVQEWDPMLYCKKEPSAGGHVTQETQAQ